MASKRRGQGVAEYGLIVLLIGIACMMVSDTLRQKVTSFFFAATDKVEEAGVPEETPPPTPTP